MNSEEYKFFKVFKKLFGTGYVIIPQMHLDDLAQPNDKHQRTRLFSLRHINQKSIDFAFCEELTMSPKIAIEIDGISHSNELTIERDKEVERILKDAQIPLVRFNNGEYGDLNKIREKITKYIS